jgi:Na+:H+ antiporter, NhaA family
MAGGRPDLDEHLGPSTPIERLARPFAIFAQHKTSGAALLLLAGLVALVWANSPWGDHYRALLQSKVIVGAGPLELSKPLILWINDALMALFFFVIGLEIKREVLAGELATFRKAALPIAGALGGMLVPAGLYALVNLGGNGAHGWGIPMATDIAFALGILAVLGSRVPLGLKVFLTALAIVDDLGAIVVIAVFYTDHIALPSLAIGGLLLIVSSAANKAGVRRPLAYLLLGSLAWLAFLKSGVHATLASVLLALTIPARTRIEGEPFLVRMHALLDRLRASGVPRGHNLLTSEQQHTLFEMEETLNDATAPLQQLEHALMPLVTFVVLPVFALANAGVDLRGGLSAAILDPVFIGVIVGLFVGKQVGITSLSWLAVRTGLADLPQGVTWRHIHGASVLAGIGFTMSLFISGLAFTKPELRQAAKLGILTASLISSVVGLGILWLIPSPAAPQPEVPLLPELED